MNTYAVSIQWATRLTLSVVEAESKEHALGKVIADHRGVALPIQRYIVANLHDNEEEPLQHRS